MDEAGLRQLFFLTGLPEAWLALRGEEQARCALVRELAVTACAVRPVQKGADQIKE